MEAQTEVTTISLYNPYPWQKAVHDGIDNAGRGTIHVVLARRQIGKSQIIVNELLRHQRGEKGYSLCVEPSFRQAKKIYKDVRDLVVGTPLLLKANESELSLTFIGDSVIQFTSAGACDRLRGMTISGGGMLAVDEGAFISDDVFYAVLLPMCNVHNPDILICSTPMFQRGFFYDLYARGIDGSAGASVVAYDLNKYDTSRLLSAEKLEEYRLTLPRRKFQTEYLGQFITAESEVFGKFEHLCSNVVSDNTQYYYGIDWATGSNNDRTAIAIFNNDRQMVDLHYFNDLDATQTIDYIVRLTAKYPPVSIVVEQNSIGAVFLQLLRKALPSSVRVTKFNTSNESKNRIVALMQVAIQNDAVQLRDDMTLKMEMSNFVAKTTAGGKTTYSADGNGHDDTIMATLIAFQSLGKTHYVVR